MIASFAQGLHSFPPPPADVLLFSNTTFPLPNPSPPPWFVTQIKGFCLNSPFCCFMGDPMPMSLQQQLRAAPVFSLNSVFPRFYVLTAVT